MNIPLPPRGEMSNRARAFLVIAVLHFGIIGVTILIRPEWYAGTVFVPLVKYTDLIPWGIGYAITSLICLVAAVTKWPTFARVGLVCAFVVLVVSAFAVGWGVVVSWCDPNVPPASPVVPISWLALAFKDLLMVDSPLRTPFQDLREAKQRLEST